MLWRALLPSWTFFDRTGFVPRLHLLQPDESWWEWVPQYSRGFRQIFLNGPGNLTLLYVSQLERLVLEVSSGSFTDNSETFVIVRDFAKELATERGLSGLVRFRVSVLAEGTREDVLHSEVWVS